MTTTEPMPDWLKRSLVAKGVLTEQGLTRRAKVMRHRPCGMLCMAGFDAPRAALDAWCEPYPLTALGEAMALVDGRGTYALWGTERLELGRRDRWMIAGRPAGSPRCPPVLAGHRCGEPLPPAWRQAWAAPTGVVGMAGDGDIPF